MFANLQLAVCDAAPRNTAQYCTVNSDKRTLEPRVVSCKSAGTGSMDLGGLGSALTGVTWRNGIHINRDMVLHATTIGHQREIIGSFCS